MDIYTLPCGNVTDNPLLAAELFACDKTFELVTHKP